MVVEVLVGSVVVVVAQRQQHLVLVVVVVVRIHPQVVVVVGLVGCMEVSAAHTQLPSVASAPSAASHSVVWDPTGLYIQAC